MHIKTTSSTQSLSKESSEDEKRGWVRVKARLKKPSVQGCPPVPCKGYVQFMSFSRIQKMAVESQRNLPRQIGLSVRIDGWWRGGYVRQCSATAKFMSLGPVGLAAKTPLRQQYSWKRVQWGRLSCHHQRIAGEQNGSQQSTRKKARCKCRKRHAGRRNPIFLRYIEASTRNDALKHRSVF